MMERIGEFFADHMFVFGCIVGLSMVVGGILGNVLAVLVIIVLENLLR